MCPRKKKELTNSFRPGFNPEFDNIDSKPAQFRKIPETARAVLLSVASTRGGAFRFFWGARNSPACELFSGGERFDPDPFFDALPPLSNPDGVVDYPARCQILHDRLGVPIRAERRTYLGGARGLGKYLEPVALVNILDRIQEGGTVVDPREFGFSLVGAGGKGSRGALPLHMGFITPHLRKRNAGIRGFTCSESVGVALDRLHGAAVRMRADFKDTRMQGVYSWEGASKGARIPEEYLLGLKLSPELWIRRRIARRSSVLSLSVFGTRQLKNGKWEVVDLTAPAALLATGTDNAGPAWRRAVYLVNRGDGYEWVLLHPDHDNYPTEVSGLPGVEYEGSPARSLVSSLRTLWDDGDKVKIRWILDDKPLQGAGEVR